MAVGRDSRRRRPSGRGRAAARGASRARSGRRRTRRRPRAAPGGPVDACIRSGGGPRQKTYSSAGTSPWTTHAVMGEAGRHQRRHVHPRGAARPGPGVAEGPLLGALDGGVEDPLPQVDDASARVTASWNPPHAAAISARPGAGDLDARLLERRDEASATGRRRPPRPPRARARPPGRPTSSTTQLDALALVEDLHQDAVVVHPAGGRDHRAAPIRGHVDGEHLRPHGACAAGPRASATGPPG